MRRGDGGGGGVDGGEHKSAVVVLEGRVGGGVLVGCFSLSLWSSVSVSVSVSVSAAGLLSLVSVDGDATAAFIATMYSRLLQKSTQDIRMDFLLGVGGMGEGT